MQRLRQLFAWLACVCVVLSLAAGFTHPSIRNIVQMKDRHPLAVPSLPIYLPADHDELRTYRMVIDRGFWPYVSMDMLVDDCLEEMQVDMVNVPLPTPRPCHFSRISRFDMSTTLQLPENQVKLVVRNLYGDIGFEAWFESLPWHLEKVLKSLAVVSLFALLLLKYGRLEQWGPATFWLALLGLMLSCMQYFSSPFNQYVNDMRGHLDYIQMIADHAWLPPPRGLNGGQPYPGWQGAQPPLYYLVAAVFYRMGEVLGTAQPAYAARFLSLLLYIGFLWLSIETLRYYLSGRYAVLAAALVLFWPDGFTYAGRINNDSAMLVSHALTLYLATRWHVTHDTRWLRFAWYSALFGLTIKGTAVVGIGFMGAMTLLALWQKLLTLRFFMNPWLGGVALLSAAADFGRTFYYRTFAHMNVHWFVNVASDPRVFLPPAPYQYLYFDLGRFIRAPFMYSAGHEDLFWNPFLKSMLLGGWVWQSNFIACELSLCLVLMLALVLVYFLFQRGLDAASACPPMLLLLLCMTGAIITYRVMVPWTPSCDARLVGGIFVPFALYVAKSIEWHRQAGRSTLAAAGEALAAVFCVLSVGLLGYELNL